MSSYDAMIRCEQLWRDDAMHGARYYLVLGYRNLARVAVERARQRNHMLIRLVKERRRALASAA